MRKGLFKVCLFTVCFSIATSTASAQEMVHALAGTVTSINPKTGMIEIKTNDASSGHFKCLTNSSVPLDFDKKVSAMTTAATKFKTDGTHVIVFYFGYGDVRTVVALRDLGNGQLEKSTGTVVKFDKHEHLLTIKNNSGTEESFRISAETVADAEMGAVEGDKFDAGKGDLVRVTATLENGSKTALFIVRAD